MAQKNASKMGLDDFASEIIVQIFYSCDAVIDVLKLGATCHRFRSISNSSKRISILYAVAEVQLGKSTLQISSNSILLPELSF